MSVNTLNGNRIAAAEGTLKVNSLPVSLPVQTGTGIDSPAKQKAFEATKLKGAGA